MDFFTRSTVPTSILVLRRRCRVLATGFVFAGSGWWRRCGPRVRTSKATRPRLRRFFAVVALPLLTCDDTWVDGHKLYVFFVVLW